MWDERSYESRSYAGFLSYIEQVMSGIYVRFQSTITKAIRLFSEL